MPTATSPRTVLAPVTTMLTPAERLRVDAAGEGLYHTIHRDSADEVLRDLRESRAGAVVLSITRCGGEPGWVGRLVREFPLVPAVALLAQLEPETPHAVLALGQRGVKTLIDVRQPNGWRELREALLGDRAGEIDRVALARLATDLEGVPEDCWRFFTALFGSASSISTVRALASELGVLASTMMSRFFRAGLPAPKRYLAMVRLIRAARLFENPGLSIASVSYALDFSSPQSFGRHVRTLLGLTAVEFRQRYDGEGMLERFREELVLPYLPVLRRFRPLTTPPAWKS
jgi:AraC-like DNA-binding protein